MLGTAEDYPYTDAPWTGVFEAKGLDKLRYVRDRGIAQQLYDMHHDLARVEEAMDVVKRAHSGMLGPEPEELAAQYFGDTLGTPPMVKVEQFIKRLETVRQAKAGRV